MPRISSAKSIKQKPKPKASSSSASSKLKRKKKLTIDFGDKIKSSGSEKLIVKKSTGIKTNTCNVLGSDKAIEFDDDLHIGKTQAVAMWNLAINSNHMFVVEICKAGEDEWIKSSETDSPNKKRPRTDGDEAQ